MKFTCDKCSAQYMISDQKVGPTGVKVRCKKCSNVILVRRPTDGATPVAVAARGRGGEKGLDAELGHAFDHAFGDTPLSSDAPKKEEPKKDARSNGEAGKDLAATQMMGEEDAAKITAAAAAPAAPAPGATEWYVAIGQAQVGPLPVGEVKKKWEAGDVGPDSLVWRPGMGDWKPLSTVSDLAAYLAPVPRPAPPAAREAPRAEPKADGASAAAAPEATWKPVGASALAALASEEIAARKSPEPRPQPSRPVPSGAKSLMDALPDGGGVDPTGAIPLSIKALETTGEKKIERRSSSVARGVAEARHRRGVTRAVLFGVVAVVLVVGAAAGGVVWYMNEKLARTSAASAPAPAASAPAPAPLPAKPAVAVAPAAVPQPPPPPRAAEPPRAAPEPEPRKAAPEPKTARTEPTSRTRKEPPARQEPTRVARADPPPPPEPPPEPKKKKGDLLDFEGNDSALDEALGNKPSGRSVYVPPARSGGTTDLPNQLSPGDINAAVAQRIDSLRKCVSDQKARDPEATGVLRMRWIIGGDGGVRDVKPLPGEFAQGPFAQCIAGVVRSTRFPRSRTTGQEVTFPFNF